MKKIIVFAIVLFVFMEGISWWMYRTVQDKPTSGSSTDEDQATERIVAESQIMSKETKGAEEVPLVTENTGLEDSQGTGTYPRISVEEVNNRIERTIHMGVRQYAWDPAVLRVKQGELVRLVIHNADVKHGIVIPDLGINEDIPPEGAVVEFVASKKGTFRSFCAVYCGEGHGEMQGTLIVE